jgi:hypothetical protein
MLYRIFVRDVGQQGYSGLRDVRARTVKQALAKFRGSNRYFLALSHNRRDLWPNSRTGKVALGVARLFGNLSVRKRPLRP